jgi:hypothetical protein
MFRTTPFLVVVECIMEEKSEKPLFINGEYYIVGTLQIPVTTSDIDKKLGIKDPVKPSSYLNVQFTSYKLVGQVLSLQMQVTTEHTTTQEVVIPCLQNYLEQKFGMNARYVAFNIQ